MILEIIDKDIEKEEEEKLRKNLGIRVAYIRGRKKISQFKLSLLTGLSKQYISDLEHGRRNASISSIYKISKGLGVDLSDLFKSIMK